MWEAVVGFPALTAAEPGERDSSPMGDTELLHELLCVGGIGAGEQVDGLAHPHPVRQAGVLQLAADLLPQPLCAAYRIETGHPDLSGVRPPQALESLDGGGLPSAIRADQADHLTGEHVEVETVDHDPSAVRLGQAAHTDDSVVRGGVFRSVLTAEVGLDRGPLRGNPSVDWFMHRTRHS